MRSGIIFLGLLFATFTQAQVITGRITDLNNYPIELAVVIIQTNDSVYVNSTYTDSLGSFRLFPQQCAASQQFPGAPIPVSQKARKMDLAPF